MSLFGYNEGGVCEMVGNKALAEFAFREEFIWQIGKHLFDTTWIGSLSKNLHSECNPDLKKCNSF